MTLTEFRAWFEGYTESIETAPSAKQWERIQARVKEITGTPVTYPVYVDRYLPWPSASPARWYPNTYYGTTAVGLAATANGLGASAGSASLQNYTDAISFNSIAAMHALGKAEAKGSA